MDSYKKIVLDKVRDPLRIDVSKMFYTTLYPKDSIWYQVWNNTWGEGIEVTRNMTLTMTKEQVGENDET